MKMERDKAATKPVGEWVNGGVDGWMDGGRDGCMEVGMVAWMDGPRV
jgi:hypothetical protein